MSKIRIKRKEYRVDEYKDELRPCYSDGRPYVVEYYKLFDEEEEEPRFLLIWSGDNYELCDDPNAVTPILEGNINEIEEVKQKPKFNFMYKFEGEKKWRDISEFFLRTLIKDFYADDDLELKIMDIKFGHPLKIRDATFEAWPRNEVN